MSDPVEAKKVAAQRLLLSGLITSEEYERLGRKEGWMSVPKTRLRRIAALAPWVGYAALAAGAALEIAALIRPDLRGPLEQLMRLADVITQGL
jgi:hypothetical protein